MNSAHCAADFEFNTLDIENSLTTIYEDHASLLHYLSQAGFRNRRR